MDFLDSTVLASAIRLNKEIMKLLQISTFVWLWAVSFFFFLRH